jgi:hypothetical protein
MSNKEKNELRIRVVIDNNECELSYPLAERQSVSYDGTSTLSCAVKAIKDIVETIKKENN